MNNKLRRAIEKELGASYDTPARKIAEQASLLTRALVALGGPVDSERPPEVTMASLPVVTSETIPEGVVGLVNPDLREAVIIGADTGDENDYDPRLELSPAEVDEYVAGLGDHDPK